MEFPALRWSNRLCTGTRVPLKTSVPPRISGSATMTSLNDFARVVNKVSGKSLEIAYQPARPEDPRRRCPDITKARTLLGWQPKVTLEDGLRKTLEAFKKEL